MKSKAFLLLLLLSCALCTMAQLVPPKEKYKASVEPLLTTKWGQKKPFNQYCPTKTNTSGEEENCPVGCVALAIGQIMKYHNYPEHGKGYKSYTPLLSTKEISADFENTYYKWDLMKDTYTSIGSKKFYTDEEADAVATLLFHTGVSVGTMYSLSGSSAFAYGNIPRDMIEDFRYAPDSIRYLSRSDYDKEKWVDLIFNELTMGRPIFYAGNSPEYGGHAFVIDGYDSSGRFHINWGWKGTDNGYYDIDLTEGENNYCDNQSMVIGIAPYFVASEIHSVENSADSYEIYDISGIRHNAVGRGMNIIRYSDGTIRKVYIR